MKNLEKINSDFTVVNSGDAFISIPKAAELCGVSKQSVTLLCLLREIDTSQGISSDDITLIVSYYVGKQVSQAVETLKVFAKAGAKAFIYHEAGVEFNNHLTDQSEKVIELETKTIANPTHEELMDWVKIGWLSCSKIITTKYVYTITDKHKLTKTKTGTIIKL